MYFPKSQIKTNLYTNGDEYALSTTKENYKGYYYQTFTGQKYTGKTPQDGPNILLIPNPYTEKEDLSASDQVKNVRYILSNVSDDSLSNQYYPLDSQITSRSLPQFNVTLPTQQDKDLGAFTRYFCKKNNELIYLEINKETYTKLNQRSTDIAWDLYTPHTILWYIKGNKEKIYNANKGIVISIEQQQKWYGFSKYLKEDYLKYFVGE